MNSKQEVMEWLGEQLVKAEKALKGREEMQRIWAGGTTRSWRAVGCTMSKTQRLEGAEVQGRIADKYRRDVEMLKAIKLELSKI